MGIIEEVDNHQSIRSISRGLAVLRAVNRCRPANLTDIAREVVAKDRSAERVNVYEIMSKPVVALPVDMKLRYAIRLLARFELSRALVVDHRREPVGLVTLREMVLRHAPD